MILNPSRASAPRAGDHTNVLSRSLPKRCTEPRNPVIGKTPSVHPAAILIVDEDRDFCEQIGEAIAKSGYTVCVAHSGLAGLEYVLMRPWQAVILNTGLADIDGPGWLRRIRGVSDVPVLLIGVHSRDADEIAALEAGADAYLAKGGSTGQLLAHLHAMARRIANHVPTSSGSMVSDEQIAVANLRIMPGDCKATLDDRELALTRSEFAILLSLVRARGHVKTRDRLYAEIRSREYGAFDRSLDVLVSGLRKKLGDSPKHPRFIRTIRSAGYMLLNPVVS